MHLRDDGRLRDSQPDYRALRKRAVELRADERAYGGHTFGRHVDIGPAGTQERASRIFADPLGSDRHRPADATRWTNEQFLARAVNHVERSQPYRTQIALADSALRQGESIQTIRPVIRLPLRDALGPDWRSGVAGHRADYAGVRPVRFTGSAEVVAVYRARPGGGWRLHTCYPFVGGQAP